MNGQQVLASSPVASRGSTIDSGSVWECITVDELEKSSRAGSTSLSSPNPTFHHAKSKSTIRRDSSTRLKSSISMKSAASSKKIATTPKVIKGQKLVVSKFTKSEKETKSNTRKSFTLENNDKKFSNVKSKTKGGSVVKNVKHKSTIPPKSPVKSCKNQMDTLNQNVEIADMEKKMNREETERSVEKFESCHSSDGQHHQGQNENKTNGGKREKGKKHKKISAEIAFVGKESNHLHKDNDQLHGTKMKRLKNKDKKSLRDHSGDQRLHQLLDNASGTFSAKSIGTADTFSTASISELLHANPKEDRLLFDFGSHEDKDTTNSLFESANVSPSKELDDRAPVTEGIHRRSPTNGRDTDAALLSWEIIKYLGDANIKLQKFDIALEMYIEARGLIIDEIFSENHDSEMSADPLIRLSWNESEILLGTGVIFYQRVIASKEKMISRVDELVSDSDSNLHSCTALLPNNQKECSEHLNEALRLLSESHRMKDHIRSFMQGELFYVESPVNEDPVDDDEFPKNKRSNFIQLEISIARTLHWMGKIHFALGQQLESRRCYREALGIHKSIDYTFLHVNSCRSKDMGVSQFKYENKYSTASLFVSTGDFHKSRGDTKKASIDYNKALSLFVEMGEKSTPTELSCSCCVLGSGVYDVNVTDLHVDLLLKITSLQRRSGDCSDALEKAAKARNMLIDELRESQSENFNLNDNKNPCQKFYFTVRNERMIKQKLREVYESMGRVFKSAGNNYESTRAFAEAENIKLELSDHSPEKSPTENREESEKFKLAIVTEHFALHNKATSDYESALKCYLLSLCIVRDNLPWDGNIMSTMLSEEPSYKSLNTEARLLREIGSLYAMNDSSQEDIPISVKYYEEAVSCHISAEVLRPFARGSGSRPTPESLQLLDERRELDAQRYYDFVRTIYLMVKVYHSLQLTRKNAETNENNTFTLILQEKLIEVGSNTAAYIYFMLGNAFWKLEHRNDVALHLISKSQDLVGDGQGIKRLHGNLTTGRFLYTYAEIEETKGDIYLDSRRSKECGEAFYIALKRNMAILQYEEKTYLKDMISTAVARIKLKLGILSRKNKNLDIASTLLNDALETILKGEESCFDEKELSREKQAVIADIYYELGMVLAALGDKKGAREAYTIALHNCKKVYNDDSHPYVRKIENDAKKVENTWMKKWNEFSCCAMEAS